MTLPATIQIAPMTSDQIDYLKRAWRPFGEQQQMAIQVIRPDEGPVTIMELRRRGLDERLQEVLNIAIGDVMRGYPGRPITAEEMEALGYGSICECGERGLSLGEKSCAECPKDDGSDILVAP
jgi:hypothetical protein